MTSTSENKQHNNKGVAIDLNAAKECIEEQSLMPSLPNGSSINGHQRSAEQNATLPSSPLKVITNIDAPFHASETTSTSSQHSSPATNGLRIPQLPRIKTTLDQGPRTPQLPNDTTLKARRWSSFTLSPRRKSFPSSRKDGFEYIRALRAEAKLAREKGPSTTISNPSTKRRKRSMSGIPSGSDEYLTAKPNISITSDVWTRSSTTSGSIPPAVRAPLRRGSHVADGSSNMGSRLEHIRRESTRSNVVENLPTTLWDYLMLEMETKEIKVVEEYKKERLSNFLRIPESLEKLIWFGWIVCLDSFLHMFTILPLRVLRAAHKLIRIQFPRNAFDRKGLHPSERADLLKGLLIILTYLCMTLFDASRVYHSIRGQSSIKLYVLFNVLDIADRLCCSIGQDIFDVLFSKNAVEPVDRTERVKKWIGNIALGLSYNVIHTSMLFFQVVTLNVAVNSYSNALLSLLMSNQFVEIKGSVFKKFEKENLFQMSCADIIERFHLSLLLTLILVRNLIEHTNSLTTPLNFPWMDLCMPFIMVLGSELLVDWCKHAFITKFNHIRPSVYGRFMDVLCMDFVKDGQEAYVDQSPTVSRRMGLPTIPLACLTLRTMGQTIEIFKQHHFSQVSSTNHIPTNTVLISSPSSTSPLNPLDATLRRIVSLGNGVGWEVWLLTNGLWLVIFILGFIAILFLKLFIGIYLLKFARSRMSGVQLREDQERIWEEGGRKVLNVGRGNPGGIEIEERVRRLLDRGEDDLLGLGRGAEGKSLLRVERYSMVSKRIW